MPHTRNKLTNAQIRNAKHEGKNYKLSDGGRLNLIVEPHRKVWRVGFEDSEGRERTYTVGNYPDFGLADARRIRDDVHRIVVEGRDPVAERRIKRKKRSRSGHDSSPENCFESVAAEWLEIRHKKECQANTVARNIGRLRNHVYPRVGHRPIDEITPPELLELLRAVEAKTDGDTPHRLKSLLGKVFRFAISTGRCTSDPSRDLADALSPPERRHRPAITDPEEFADLLRAIDGYRGTPETLAALKLSALLFARPGEIRQLRWTEIDWNERLWYFRPSKTGPSKNLVIATPLPHQVSEILEQMNALSGESEFVFPSAHGDISRPMSENTVNVALKRLGYRDQAVAHGFRATARTLLVETLGFPAEIVEMQLGHAVRDPLGRAYNRAKWIEERARMLQQWANYLDALRTCVSREDARNIAERFYNH